MKKFLLALLAFPVLAVAGASSNVANRAAQEPPTSGISITHAQRSLTFGPGRNTTTVDGMILVCQHPNKYDENLASCVDNAGKNQWADILGIQIPGYVLVSFEYRLSGYGSRYLFLYFGKK
jgi:hypothetical protein